MSTEQTTEDSAILVGLSIVNFFNNHATAA